MPGVGIIYSGVNNVMRAMLGTSHTLLLMMNWKLVILIRVRFPGWRSLAPSWACLETELKCSVNDFRIWDSSNFTFETPHSSSVSSIEVARRRRLLSWSLYISSSSPELSNTSLALAGPMFTFSTRWSCYQDRKADVGVALLEWSTSGIHNH